MRGLSKLATACAVLSLVVFGLGISVRAWMGDRRMAQALEEQKRGNLNGARILFRKALELGRGEAAIVLARTAHFRQDLEDVEMYAALAMRADPTDGHAHLLLAYALAEAGGETSAASAAAALRECRKAVSLEPAEGSLWKSCADLLLRLYLRGGSPGSGTSGKEALREESLRGYREALRLGGGADATLRAAAEAYPDPAFLAEAVSGGDVAAISTAASLLLAHGRWEESRTSWREVAESSGAPGAYALAAAEALRGARRLGEALDSYRKALERTPDDDRAWYGMGRAAEELGDRDTAKRSYRRALELSEGNRRYREALARFAGAGE